MSPPGAGWCTLCGVRYRSEEGAWQSGVLHLDLAEHSDPSHTSLGRTCTWVAH